MTNVETIPSSSRSWAELIETFIRNSLWLPQSASQEAKRAELDSQYIRTLRRFLQLASENAKAEGLAPDDDEAEDFLDRAYVIATDLLDPFTDLPYSDEERQNLDAAEVRRRLSITYPAEPLLLRYHLKQHGRLGVDRTSVEASVRGYLESDFKHREIDRILLLALTDMEITAYIDEMETKDFFSRKSPAELAREPIWWSWTKGRVRSLLSWALVALCGLFLNYLWQQYGQSFSPNLGTPPFWFLPGVLGFSVVMFAASTLFTFVTLVLFGRKYTENAEHILSTLAAAVTFYQEFRSSGPISVRFFRQRLEETRQVGIIWPSSVWALLDDIEARGQIIV